MFLKIKEYDNGKPIIFGLNAMRTPYSVAVKASDLTSNAEARKVVPEGSFVVSVGGEIRFLPRTRLKLATATNSPAVTVKAPCANFKVGDTLRAVAGYAEINLAGTYADDDILTINVNGTNYSVTASGDTNVTLAGKLAALTIPNVTLTQVAGSGKVVAIAKDSYKLTVHCTGAGAFIQVNTTDHGYFGDYLLPLGTIASIGAANNAGERVLTLAANAAYVLPVNTPVGVDVEKFLGIYPEQLDLTELPVEHIAPIYHADGVYENNLPYCDNQIKRTLHGLNINPKFYANA